jgi:hypothetical protein
VAVISGAGAGSVVIAAGARAESAGVPALCTACLLEQQVLDSTRNPVLCCHNGTHQCMPPGPDMSESGKKLTISDLQAKKRAGERVVLTSVTDYLMAQWAERGGVDVVAVGDSLGMITYGHPNTLPMTIGLAARSQWRTRSLASC